ncbi:TRIAP1 [Bugula neritina]|uniref:TRIAP1 n=1 Tax=Bugula neritina TaxID=10212 RepID=A0A7J7JX06_BUGNE|nr:TRIAP1 [Bugula neritina]
MDSIGEECKELKKKYDECFNEWFGEQYLKGKTTDPCKVLFKEYRECVHRVLVEKGIDVQEAYEKVLGTSKELSDPNKKETETQNVKK